MKYMIAINDALAPYVHHTETAAADQAKQLASLGNEVRIYKLVETHYFKGKPNADAVKPG